MEKKRMIDRGSAGLLVVALALSMLPLGGIPAATAQGSAVYINEIQVSTSSYDWEFFELQGTPGTDLSGLALVGIESD